MDYLYDIRHKETCFFQEILVDRVNADHILYQQDVKRKTDPLLIVFQLYQMLS